jgi:hypothetical protein
MNNPTIIPPAPLSFISKTITKISLMRRRNSRGADLSFLSATAHSVAWVLESSVRIKLAKNLASSSLDLQLSTLIECRASAIAPYTIHTSSHLLQSYIISSFRRITHAVSRPLPRAGASTIQEVQHLAPAVVQLARHAHLIDASTVKETFRVFIISHEGVPFLAFCPPDHDPIFGMHPWPRRVLHRESLAAVGWFEYFETAVKKVERQWPRSIKLPLCPARYSL